jgi:O-antigen/teichoic acid export membrane protein
MIGMVSMLFVYPLDHETYGTAQFFIGCILLLLPFASLGLPQVIIKFFAEFDSVGDGRKLLPTLLVCGLVISFCFAVLFYLCRGFAYASLESAGFDIILLQSNMPWILASVGAVLIFYIINSFLTNYGKVAIPVAIQDLGFKLFLPALVLLSAYGTLAPTRIAPLIFCYYTVSIIVVLAYGAYYGLITYKLDLTFFKEAVNRKTVLTYGLFIALTSLGSMMAFRLDSFMITTLLDAEQNGLYFNILVMASVIDMPNKSIGKVAGPIIAKNWSLGNTNEISKMYTKSSILNQIVGSLIFIGVLVNLEHLFDVSSNPEAFTGGVLLFVVIGIAKLLDGIAGVNSQVLSYSEAYKYNLYFMLFLAALSISTNYILIPEYGVLGAAIATCVSLTAFNLLKLMFLYTRYRLQPLSTANLVIAVVTVVVASCVWWIPAFRNDLLSIIVKSTIVLVLFLPLIYWTRVSQDFNDIMSKQVLARWKAKS